MVACRQKMAKYHNQKVKKRSFSEGDLEMRKMEINRGDAGIGKLGANWEGPYKIIRVVRPGTYKLQSMEGRVLPRTWNVKNLKKNFQ